MFYGLAIGQPLIGLRDIGVRSASLNRPRQTTGTVALASGAFQAIREFVASAVSDLAATQPATTSAQAIATARDPSGHYKEKNHENENELQPQFAVSKSLR